MEYTRVFVECGDDVVRAGLISLLEKEISIKTVSADAPGDIDVTLAVADQNFSGTVSILRKVADERKSPVVLVTSRTLGDAELVEVIRNGVVVILPRKDITAERLSRTVKAAALGHGSMSSLELGLLLKNIQHSLTEYEYGLSQTDTGLARREIEVIKLLADGLDTSEVSGTLHFSERTVKNVIHGALRRFNLKNRTHLVAYALRNHII